MRNNVYADIGRRWLSVISFACLLIGCASPPTRNLSEEDLLVESDVMPIGWVSEGVLTNFESNEGQEASASVGFSAEIPPYLARAVERIFRYARRSKASWHYDRLERTYFNDESVYRTSPWQVPAGLTFSSPSAEKWRLECAGSNFSTGLQDGTTSTICIYLAQYDEFLVFFTVTTEIDDQSFMTMTELARVIEAIDQKMSEQLGQD